MAIAGYALGYASFFSVVVVGLLAAMAIPAFQSVRSSAQEAAVQSNLQQLYYAAQQYALENDVVAMEFDDLVGPGKLIEEIRVIHGEVYPTVIRAEQPLTVTLEDGRTIIFPED